MSGNNTSEELDSGNQTQPPRPVEDSKSSMGIIVSVSSWGHENKQKTSERHRVGLQDATELAGSLPIIKRG